MEAKKELLEVISLWQGRLVGDRAGGYADEAISRHERGLAKPLPWELRELYRAFGPAQWDTMTHDSGEPSFLPLENLAWNNGLVYTNDEITDANGPEEPSWIVFGSFGYGDLLVWCERHPPQFHRAVLFVYHEGEEPLVLGDSLAGWLRRLYICNGTEYADTIAELHSSSLTAEERDRVLNDHIRLNPARRQEIENDFHSH